MQMMMFSFLNNTQKITELLLDDEEKLVEIACNLIDEYILNNFHKLQEPSFHITLNDEIFEMLKLQMENIYDEFIEESLYTCITIANSIYFTTIMSRRSYKISFTKNIDNDKKAYLTKQIEYLRNVPQPEQRTKEWYDFRWNLITASNAWKGLSAQSNINSLIYEKCCPINTTKYEKINVEGPFHWGQKYEPLSVIIYEDMYNTKVEDFGCIQHKKYKFLGASPDGIIIDEKSLRYGRMLEIKNRFSESVPITGNPKLEYWVQMQLQMNVCELDECDLLETRFMEYDNKEAFDTDGTFTKTHDDKQKGIYIFFMEKKGDLSFPFYAYPSLNLSVEEFTTWEEKTMLENADKEWISNIYWKLEKFNCVLVTKNKKWFELYAVKELGKVWDIILKEREEGYEHRAAKKRVKQTNTIKTSKCMIDINALLHL